MLEIKKEIRKEVERLGWELCYVEKDKIGSYVVMSYREDSPFKNKNYIVHTFFNGALYSGQYDLSIDSALKEFNRRRKWF